MFSHAAEWCSPTHASSKPSSSHRSISSRSRRIDSSGLSPSRVVRGDERAEGHPVLHEALLEPIPEVGLAAPDDLTPIRGRAAGSADVGEGVDHPVDGDLVGVGGEDDLDVEPLAAAWRLDDGVPEAGLCRRTGTTAGSCRRSRGWRRACGSSLVWQLAEASPSSVVGSVAWSLRTNTAAPVADHVSVQAWRFGAADKAGGPSDWALPLYSHDAGASKVSVRRRVHELGVVALAAAGNGGRRRRVPQWWAP